MRIKSRFVLITGGFLIAVVFYQIGRARQPDKTKKFYLDGPNPDSGKLKKNYFKYYFESLFVNFRLLGSRERSFWRLLNLTRLF